MKFERVLVALFSMIAIFLPVGTAATNSAVSSPESGFPQERLNHQNLQLVIEWLTTNGILDRISATELALSLTPKEVDALAQALSNPMVKKASGSIVIVHSR